MNAAYLIFGLIYGVMGVYYLARFFRKCAKRSRYLVYGLAWSFISIAYFVLAYAEVA